ncbi:MAG: heavy-metal-associated domain-containing protein [Firmicutes bacterium]|nr:heavy-metal-associated domain-containing protein [Bacillota bacterium]MCM1401616.1 heavy-metal-associated domain-containing protein [Bacteroides sp.]MCM1477765.1 heavy-metal-associated domain-containing protein [Bacteroides sp.]
MKRLFTLTFAIAMAITVMAAEKATAYFTVTPGMSCENCENKIKTNLRYEKGVKEISTSLADQIVTVTYDPAKTNTDKLVESFKKIGYTASTVTAPKGNKHNCAKAHDCKNKKEGKCSGNGACCKAKAAKDGKTTGCAGKTCTKDKK